MTKLTYTLSNDGKVVAKLIEVAGQHAKSLRHSIQIAAVAIIYHAMKHSDYSKANDLLTVVGHGVKRDSLVKFFKDYAGLTSKAGSNKFDGWQGKDFMKANFNAAKDQMWWELKKDESNGFNGYSLEDSLKTLLSKHNAMMKKAAKMNEEDKAKVNSEVSSLTIEALLALTDFEVLPVSDDSDDDLDAELIEQLKVAS